MMPRHGRNANLDFRSDALPWTGPSSSIDKVSPGVRLAIPALRQSLASQSRYSFDILDELRAG